MKFDVIRAVEACYASAADDSGWLDGLLQSLSLHEDEPRILAEIWGIGRDGNRAVECEANSGVIQSSELADIARFMTTLSDEARGSLFAATPPVESCLKRVARASSELAAQCRALLQRHGVEDPLGVFAAEPDGRLVLVAAANPAGRPLLPARTLHQLTLVSAHLNSGLRLRTALSGSAPDATTHAGTDAVLDPGGRVIDAFGGARAREARQSLAEAVRHMDRARGALRRTDPEEALRLWRGLVDGTWSLVDHCEADGKRFVLARRNEPGVRDPKALTPRERSVAAFAAMGHQNKFIGYLLGLSAGAVSGHLRSAQQKLELTSRAELVRCLAPLLPDAVPAAEQHP